MTPDPHRTAGAPETPQPYDTTQDFDPNSLPPRRDTLSSLTTIGRVLLTLMLIGLFAILVSLLWRPLTSRTPAPTPTILAAEGSPILPTFTPGPTATPLATITTTPAPTSEVAATPGAPTGG